jgi:hypothetical protein
MMFTYTNLFLNLNNNIYKKINKSIYIQLIVKANLLYLLAIILFVLMKAPPNLFLCFVYVWYEATFFMASDYNFANHFSPLC